MTEQATTDIPDRRRLEAAVDAAREAMEGAHDHYIQCVTDSADAAQDLADAIQAYEYAYRRYMQDRGVAI
jgi:hypothetical protein